MAALEYLTLNGLTAYPFKRKQPTSVQTNHPVQDDWFYDILFVSYDITIRKVFISKIEKTSDNTLKLVFTNIENLEDLSEITISSSDFVNHYNNTEQGFASASFSRFSVKLVFGPGLLAKDPFVQTYVYSSNERYVETELTSSAIILKAPSVDNLNFETYDTDRARAENVPDEPFVVAAFPSLTDLPIVVNPRHNSIFNLTSTNSGELHVSPGLGAGLYDPCVSTGEITDVYSVNRVSPNSEGSLFLKTSNCYSANVLTENDAILFGGFLDPYRRFTINLADGSTGLFNAVHPDHGISLQNFCKPKCAPETLGAFAHYLNRIEDASLELSQIAFNASEIRGKCSAVSFNTLNAIFCVLDSDNPFVRCSDPAHPEYVACNVTGFKKYFHEGRKLQVYFSAQDIQEFEIVEVISASSVRVDKSLLGASNVYFRVVDNGVIGNMNCAVSAYNEGTSTLLNPYFKVKYTTTEAYSPSGEYVTYLTLAVAIFNPSSETIGVSLEFNPVKLTRQGDFKIRTKDAVAIVNSPSVTLGCRDYAFIEAVYYIKCETYNGALTITASNITDYNSPIGEPFYIANVDGTPCPGVGGSTDTSAGVSVTYSVLQGSWQTFSQQLAVPGLVALQSVYGNVPTWLRHTVNAQADTISLALNSKPTEESNKTFILFFNAGLTGGANTICRVTLNYEASPIIISPLGTSYPSSSPLIASKNVTYTAQSPLLRILATNMTAETGTSYNLTVAGGGAIPSGLLFNSSTGAITGQISSQILDDTALTLNISCSNNAGVASNPQTISLAVKSNHPPTVSFSDATPGPTLQTSNLITHFNTSPLVQLLATNTPIYEYSILGQLPTGLFFDKVQGRITGRITEETAGTKAVFVTATNQYGESSPLQINITYTIALAPSISFPANKAVYSIGLYSQTTLESPLFTITATQALGGTDNLDPELSEAARNIYSANGLPPGFSISANTGKVYGSLASTEIPTIIPFGYTKIYAFNIYAKNPVGVSSSSVSVTFKAITGPVINNIIEGSVFTLTKGRLYTTNEPFLKLAATGATAFSADNLPPGLSCTANGNIVGSVQTDAVARRYAVVLKATNNSSTYSLNCSIIVPLSIISPVNNSSQVLSVGTAYSNIATISVCAVHNNEPVTLSASGLPTGVTLNNNVLSGTPTTTGAYQISVSASTASFSAVSVQLSIAITNQTYVIAGNVLSPNSAPIAGVKVNADAFNYSLTNSLGEYEITGLTSGTYILSAAKDNYYIPSVLTAVVDNANVSGLNFTATGPVRKITGNLATSTGEPIYAATISGGLDGAISNVDGSYTLYAQYNTAYNLQPSASSYVFSPGTYALASGTSDLSNINFVGLTGSIPSEPKDLIITPGNGQLSIAFTPPENNGGVSLANYEYSLNGSSFVQSTSSISPVVITGLINGNNYSIRLRAVNSFGSGVTSLTYTAAPSTTPGVPTIVSPIYGYEKQLVVFFTPNTNYSGTPTLDLEYSTDAGLTFRSAGVASSPITINTTSANNTRLVNATVYPVVIRAVNAKGIGAPSLVLNGTPVAGATAPTIVVGAPTDLTYIPQDKGLLVNFTPPTNTGGEAILNYRYSLDSGNNYVTIFPATGAVSSFTILKDHLSNDLVNGTVYQLLIAANTATSELPPTANPILAIPGTVPGVISDISIASGDKKLTVSFSPPTNSGGYNITEYQYSVDGGAFIPTNSTGLLIILSNLNNGQAYSIRLRAVNIIGIGATSTAVVKKPATAPSAPTIITPLTILNAGARFDFNAPTSNGGAAISKYQYNITPGSTWIDATVAAPQAGGTGSIQLSGLSNGVTYPLRLRAINESDIIGISSTTTRFTPFTVPTAPVISSVTQATNTSINVAFTVPTSNGGSAITGYKYSTNGGISYSSVVPENQTTINITNLIQNNNYTVVLKAVNSAGESSPSNTIAITLLPLYTAPTILVPIVSKNQGFDVIFNPPSNAPYNLSVSYEYSLNRGSIWVPATVQFGPSQNTLKIALSGLTNGQEYNVVVRAVTSLANGETSNTVIAIPANPPDAPTQISTTPLDSQIAVKFTPPANNGGAPITDYKYSLNGAEFVSSGKAESPITISPLRNGAAYYIRLAAVNSAGIGSPSATPQTPTMPGISPDNPTNVIVAANSSAKAVISFTVGDSGTSPITDYEYSIDGGATWISGATTSSPITTNSATLVNGTTYNFQIRARSLVGTSLGTTSITKLWGLPNAPVDVKYHTITPTTISAQFTSPQLSWQPSITSYQYSINGGSNWTTLPTGDTLPLSITGLTRGTTYKISVRAINSIGTGENAVVQTVILGVAAPPTIELVDFEIHDPQGTYSGHLDSQTTGYTRTLNIYFTPPAYDGGYPITNYEYSLDGGLTFTAANDTRSPLNINIPYPYITGNTAIPVVKNHSIVLRSVNSLGKSIASEKYVDRYTNPTAPLITSISAKNNSAAIYFNPPLLIGSESILRYEYGLQLDNDYGDPNWTDSGVNSSPIQITGLTSGTTYKVRIRAVNSDNLTGLDNLLGRLQTLSALGTFLTFSTPLGPSGPPSSDTPAIIAGSNKITIPWTVSNNGGHIPWRLEYSLNGGLTYIRSNNATSPLTIDSGLTYGTKYDIRLRLLTVNGPITPPNYNTQVFIGEPFSVGIVTTMSDGPDAPVITGYTTAFSSSAVPTTTINFTPPGLGLDQVLGYQYSLDNGDTWVTTPSADPLALSFSVDNIAHKSLFRLRSVVSTGFGEESSTKPILLPPSRPIIPEIVLFAYRTDGFEYFQDGPDENVEEQAGCYRYNLRFINTEQRKIPNPAITKYMISISDDGVSYGDWVDLTGDSIWDGTGAITYLNIPGSKSQYNCFYKRLDFPKKRTYFISDYVYDNGMKPSGRFDVPAELCLPGQATDFTSAPFVAYFNTDTLAWQNHIKYIKIRACNSVGCSDATEPFIIEYLSIT